MRTELQQRLAALHAQLERTQTVDPQARELLLALLHDITRLTGGGGGIDSHSLNERLDTLAVEFEAEHPALGTALRQLLDTLGKAGI